MHQTSVLFATTQLLLQQRITGLLFGLFIGFLGVTPLSAQEQPTDVSASPGDNAVSVTWEAPNLDADEEIEGYNIYRNTRYFESDDPDGVDAERINTSPVTNRLYTDSSVSNGITYFYRVSTLISENGDPAEEFGLSQGERGIDFATPSSPPAIVIEAPTPALRPDPIPEQEMLTIEADITDDLELGATTLHHRQGGEAEFIRSSMARANGIFEGSIAPDRVSARGIEYFITAVDTAGVSARVPRTGYISVPVETTGLSTTQGGGTSQTAFRIISPPLNLEENNVGSVFRDNIGPFDSSEWRLFTVGNTQLGASGDYQEIEDPAYPFAPTDAFWLISRSSVTIGTGEGVSVRTDEVLEVPLQEGWNLVGMPYAFALPRANLSVTNTSAALNDVLAYSGKFVPVESGDLIRPFQGYLIRLSDGGTGTLVIDPDRSSSEEARAQKSGPESLAWEINIDAQVQDARDTYNVAGAAPEARQGYDMLDRFNPPPIGEYVTLYFTHDRNRAGNDQERYRRDVRPVGQDPFRWDFDVQTPIRDKVTLTFSGMDTVPAAYDILLVDETLGVEQNVRTHPEYRFTAPGPDLSKRFHLLVGTPADLEEATDELGDRPGEVELGPNFPNPFRTATTIRFGLPAPMPVSLHVYDILGRRVATLLSGNTLQKGYHTVVWDADEGGSALSSGTYFYRLEAGTTVHTGRMTRVR